MPWRLEHRFVRDEVGRRAESDWLPAEQIAKDHRLKVKHRRLNHRHRTLDALPPVMDQTEGGLYPRLRNLFAIKVELVFYDSTGTYFCRKSPRVVRRVCPDRGMGIQPRARALLLPKKTWVTARRQPVDQVSSYPCARAAVPMAEAAAYCSVWVIDNWIRLMLS